MDPSPPTESATERLLSDLFGVAVSITASEHLAPWSVKRCHLSGGSEAGLPASVVVKWLRSHPQGLRTQLSQVHSERAALEFLAGLGVGLGPELLAADDAAGVLVLEDLPHSAPLYDLLARDDRLAATGLSAFARTVAALHAATVGLENSYYERRRAFGPVDLVSERDRFLGHGRRETPALVEAMPGCAPGRRCRARPRRCACHLR